jgi:hypothetical protein
MTGYADIFAFVFMAVYGGLIVWIASHTKNPVSSASQSA